MGKDFKLTIPYTEVISIDRPTKIFLANEIIIKTREEDVCALLVCEAIFD